MHRRHLVDDGEGQGQEGHGRGQEGLVDEEAAAEDGRAVPGQFPFVIPGNCRITKPFWALSDPPYSH